MVLVELVSGIGGSLLVDVPSREKRSEHQSEHNTKDLCLHVARLNALSRPGQAIHVQQCKAGLETTRKQEEVTGTRQENNAIGTCL